MGNSIFVQLCDFAKLIGIKLKILGSRKEGELANPENLAPRVFTQKSTINNFNISDEANILNESGEFNCMLFNKDPVEESWVFQKTLILLGKDCAIQIEVTIRYNEDLITFCMPMYEEGSEGLIGDNLDIFNALIHQFNSRTKNGYFTKDTSDDSYALVFMNHFLLSRMDPDWFKSTLDQFVKTLIVFRPLFDYAISKLELKFEKNAGLEDLSRKYIEERRNDYSLLGDTNR